MPQPPDNDRLSAWIDGELDPSEAARLEAELRARPDLREELEMVREAAAFLREAGPARAPDGFHGRVMAAVQAEAPANNGWAWLRRPFGIGVERIAIGLAAAAVLWLALPRPSGPGAGDVTPAAQMKGERPAEAYQAGVDAEPEQELGDETDDEPRELRSVGYRYRLHADGPGVVASVQELASRHGGTVRAAEGGTPGVQSEPVAAYKVRLPADAVSAFNQDLDALGVRVEREVDHTLFARSPVEIGLTVVLQEAKPMPKGAEQAPPMRKGAPPKSQAAPEEKAPPSKKDAAEPKLLDSK